MALHARLADFDPHELSAAIAPVTQDVLARTFRGQFSRRLPFTDEHGAALLDVSDGLLPDPATPAGDDPAGTKAAIEAEGERLLGLIEPGAHKGNIEFVG